MIRFLSALLFLLFSLSSSAQLNHFVYLQTDNNQAFYVRLNDRLYSSSSSGYVVIPKLTNGDYVLSVGFPKNEWPMQQLPVSVKNNDIGFMLKNFGAKGWGLFNMQTLDVTMANGTAAGSTASTETKTDGFSNMLADVVNTPSLKQQAVTPVVETKPAPVVKEEVVVETPKAPVETPEPTAVPLKPANTIAKMTTSLDKSGRTAIYIDRSENGADTIRIFIPYATEEKPVTEEAAPVVRKEPVKKPEPAKQDSRFLDIELENPNTKTNPALQPVATTTATPDPVIKKEAGTAANAKPATTGLSINSDCKNLATDADFIKARKKMAAEDNDDDMIGAARKLFKSKCYSVEQVKNLGVLFLKEEGRYKFFDAAYPFVYDTQNFGSLEAQLSDPYLINRFKAMIRH